MPTVSSEYIEQVVATGVAPYLKTLGFSRRGRRFLLADGLSTANVTVQASRWNTPSCTRFTLNLGRYFEAIERKMPIVLEPSKQRPHHIGSRIGDLLPTRGDHWWSSSKDEDIPVVTSEVVAALRDYGMPYLESVATLHGVAELSGFIPGFGPRPTLVKAAALDLLGRDREAEEVRRELSRRVKPSSNDGE
jgi:Domain of unknown function (DUF4304)